MRVAVLSDLHGNLTAFEAALAHLRGEYDQIVCLGDVAAVGPQPRETIERLRELNCPVVMGNTDAWLLDPQPKHLRSPEKRISQETELWSAAQLRDEDRAYLRGFQPTVEIPLGGPTLLCYHGSPKSNTDPIEPNTSDKMLHSYFADCQAEVLAGGHTHEAMLRRYQRRVVINPGSVGMSFDGGTNSYPERRPPWAEYALITSEDSALSIEFRRAPFDREQVVKAILGSGMPHAEYWANQWSRP